MADLLTQYDPSLEQKRQAAEQAAGTAVNYQSAASLLPAKLKSAIQEKLNYNQDIISQQNQAMANYFSAPSQARQDYQNIWNPFEREALVSKATSNAYAPYATLTDILGQRQGNINDIISAGTGAFNSAVTAQQGQAQIAQNAYENAISNAKWGYEMTHPKASSAAAQSPFEKLIEEQLMKAIQGGGQDNQSYQEPPMSPARAGIQYEYPPGSGVVWVSNAQGGWD